MVTRISDVPQTYPTESEFGLFETNIILYIKLLRTFGPQLLRHRVFLFYFIFSTFNNSRNLCVTSPTCVRKVKTKDTRH